MFLLFAYGKSRFCHDVAHLVPQACVSYDLKISTKKAEVVYQPVPGKPYVQGANHHSE